MFKRAATILNRLVACLFTDRSTGMKDKPRSSANSSPAQSGQEWQDAQAPVIQKRKRKPSAVKADTKVSSRKQTQKVVLAVLGQGGLQRQILAHQPASKSPKRKPLAAQQTKAEASPKQTQKPALLTSGKAGSQPVTPALPMPLPAKPAVRAKAARVLRTSQVATPARGKAAVQTRTAAQSGVRGKQAVAAPPTRQPAKPRKKAKA